MLQTVDVNGLPQARVLFEVGDERGGVLGGVPFDAAAVVGSLRDASLASRVVGALSRFTGEQLNVVHHTVNCSRNLIVESTAGSGKSTVLRTVADVLPSGLRVGAFALNRTIAAELKGALPRDVRVGTFHGYGRELIEEYCPRQAVFVEHRRINIIRRLLKEWGLYSKGMERSVSTLVQLSMVHIANSVEGLNQLVVDQELEFPEGFDVLSTVKAIQDEALREYREKGWFDYADMLYLPLRLAREGYGFGSLDIVLVDEAQDFSRLQHRLVRHIAGQSGRVIFVGDPAQAIYGFSGADAQGLDRARETFDAVTLRLTTTFRCPVSHVVLAQEFSGGIEAAPQASEGEVAWVSEEELLPALRAGDLVMCRKNAPLLSMALRVVASGLAVEVLGHDLVKTFERHVQKCFAYPFEVGDVEERLHQYGMSLMQEHYEKGIRGKVLRKVVQGDVDLLSCVAALAGEVGMMAQERGEKGTAQAIMGLVNALFEKKGGAAVRFCTVHKAKGLEARRVALLGANEVIEAGRLKEEQGDDAVAFVALTRGKELLWLVGSEGEGEQETD